MTISGNLRRLQDTTAQIRVRGAVVLLIAFAAIAEKLGLETILGAFMAGAVLTLVDRDQAMTHPDFRRKLEAIGFGVFIPVFFVTSGIRYDLQALAAKPSNLLMVPIFLGALVAVRGDRAAPVCRAPRQAADPGGGAHAGDVAALHRRGHGHRCEPSSPDRRRERRAHRRRAALRAPVPAHRADAPAPRRPGSQGPAGAGGAGADDGDVGDASAAPVTLATPPTLDLRARPDGCHRTSPPRAEDPLCPRRSGRLDFPDRPRLKGGLVQWPQTTMT